MINPMRQGPTRVMGMMSGMDTESIIQATLRMHQFRIDNQVRNRRVLEWRQEIHNSLRDEITNLRQTFLSNLGSKTMMNRNAFNANTVAATGRNSDAVTLRALAGGATGQFRIGQISELATGASARTTDSNRAAFVGTQGTARLDSFQNTGHPLSSLGFSGPEQVQLQVGNQSVRINKSEIDSIDWAGDFTNRFTHGNAEVTLTRGTGDSLDFTIREGENTFSGNVTFVDGVAKAVVDHPAGTSDEDIMARNALAEDIFLTVTRDTEGSTDGQIRRNGTAVEFTRTHTIEAVGDRPAVTLTQREPVSAGVEGTVVHNGATLDYFQTTTLNINGAPPIEIRSNMTINQMMTAVNNSGAGVRMSFESLTGRFSLETTATGVNSSLTLNGQETLDFFGTLGMNVPGQLVDDPNGAQILSWTDTGRNAELFINGDKVSVESNTFTFAGVSITLNRTTDGEDDGASGSGDISVNVTRDTDDTIARIREFIDAYNSIISRLETLSTERKTGNQASFTALTDEERRAMSDREVEEWENIARIGIMRGDQGIQNLASNLRRSFFEPIAGMGISASQIGLTTGNHFDGTGGQIMIDEERLRAALEEDPDRVADIFIKIDDNGQGVGLLHNINNLTRDFVNTNQATSLRNLEDSVRRTNEQIERMETRMWAEEERLYRQFAAMETALASLQQQGDWFSAMLGG